MDFLQFGQLTLATMVTYMVLKFFFRIIERKFDEQNLEQQTLTKVIEVDADVDSIAKTVEKTIEVKPISE